MFFYAPACALLNTSALAWDQYAMAGNSPVFYPQTLLFYPLALQTESVPGPEHRSGADSLYKFTAKYNSGDAAQNANGALQGFSIRRKNWEENPVGDLKLNLSVIENWVQLSVRQSQSVYAADPDYLGTLANKNKNLNLPGKERFLLREGAEGNAGIQRIDFKLFDSGFLAMSAFAFHSDVDLYYESLASLKAKDEFAIPNRSSDASGVKVRLGSASLTTTYTNATLLRGANSPTETRIDQTLAFDLADFRKRFGDALPGMIWELSPTSIYVSLFNKETSYKTALEGPPDRTTGLSSGANWAWKGGSANVNYWNYSLDSQRIGEASYDSAGRGVDASVGGFAGAAGFYAGLSYRRSDDLAPLSRAVEKGYDVYASAYYKPQRLPDLVIDGNIGRYGYNSVAYAVMSGGTYWSVTFGLDFSKYLSNFADAKPPAAAKSVPGGAPSLKMFYRFYSETDYGLIGGTPGDSHFVGMMFRAAH
jgi:hypothetical protein